MLSSVSFRHPSATEGSSCSDRHRPWVFLDTVSYTDMDDDEIPHNGTTATACTSSGATVEVTFALADPPGVSSWFVRCTGTTTKRKPAQRASYAQVLRAEGGLLLLRVFADNTNDFFVYSAGSGNPPSLHLLPRPYPPAFCSIDRTVWNSVAILPRGGNGDLCERQYLVVIPKMQLKHRDCSYVLHVFSSQTERWSAKAATVDWYDEETNFNNVVSHRGSKVVVVDDGDHGGGGRLVVGWVDLWQGVLTCDVLDANPVMRLIQLPPPRPGNMVDYGMGMGYEMTNAQSCRYATYSDGCFRFVEIDSHSNDDDDDDDTIYSSNATEIVGDNGWTATIWKRPVSSSEWSVCCTIDTSKISVSDSCSPHLLPEMRCDNEANKMNFNRVIAAGPTLGLHDDRLYMMCKLKLGDSKAWVLTVDTENKIEALSLFSAERMYYFEPTYIPCSFSSYLGAATNANHLAGSLAELSCKP